MSTISIDTAMYNALTAQANALAIVGLQTLAEECVYMLPGCSELMLRKELQLTFRKFCQNTGALIVKDSGKVTYESADLPLCKADGEFYIFIGAKLDDSECTTDDVTLVKEDGIVTVTFDNVPEDYEDDGVTLKEHDAEVTYSYIPAIGSENAPLWFIKKWGDAIVAGTLFRLLAMPNKPWTDPETARLKALDYQNAMNNATIERLTGGTGQDLNCRAPLPFLI